MPNSQWLCFVLSLLLFQGYSQLWGQNNIGLETCHYLVFEDRPQMQVQSFVIHTPGLPSVWGESLTRMIQHALIESNCFTVRRRTPEIMDVPPLLYLLSGEVLDFSEEKHSLSLAWQVVASKTREIVMQDTLYETCSPAPPALQEIYGVPIPPSNLSPSIPTLCKQSIEHLTTQLTFLPPKTKNTSALPPQRDLLHLMVIPNLETLAAIKKKIKEDPLTKNILHAVAKSLEDQGYVVKNFADVLKNNRERARLSGSMQTDPFQIFLENAPTDLLIYVDVDVQKSKSGTSLSLLLTAKDRFTAQGYCSTPVLRSTQRNWPDLYPAVREALHSNGALDDFVAGLDQSLQRLQSRGRPTSIRIEFSSATHHLDSPLPNAPSLKVLLIDWLRKLSVTQQVHLTGGMPHLLQLEVPLPMYNPEMGKRSPLDHGHALQAHLSMLLKQYQIPFEKVVLKGVGSRLELTVH